MPTPNRPLSQNKYTEQNMGNTSFDEDFGVNAVEILGHNSSSNVLERIKSVSGVLQTSATDTSALATSAKQDTLLTELQLKADLTETQPVSLASVPSHPVTGTFFQATQPISGTVDTELPAPVTLGDGAANPTTSIIGVIGIDFNGTTYDRQRSSFTQTTTGITANSNGTAIDMTTDPKRMCAITAIIAGDTSTFDVRLEGSLNNSNWTELLAITNVTPGDGKLGFSVDKPVLYLRYRVAGITRVSGSLSIIILAVE